MQDAVTVAMENAIESNTGTQVDLPEAREMENNGGYVNYKSDAKTYLTEDEKIQASVLK